MQQVIKTHKNNNHYLLTESGLWVRDFNRAASPVDINNLINSSEQQLLVTNENANLSLHLPEIGSDNLPVLKKCLIVSDGYRFNEMKPLLNELPRDVTIIGVNGALAKWDVTDGKVKRAMNYYFINNPYGEAARFMPKHEYYPRCICSLRTNKDFLRKYKGLRYFYVPTPDVKYGRRHKGFRPMDDYRNPICGAICFAAKCKVRKLALMGCDDAFDAERPGAEQLPNGMWMYPQHYVSHQIINGLCYWLKNNEDLPADVVNHSHGPDYKYATYIEKDRLMEFFNNER